MSFNISEQPFVYKEFLMYMQTIRGKSMGTISEYALDLSIFFKYMLNHFEFSDPKLNIDEIDISTLDYDFVKKIQLTDIYEYLSYMNTVRKNSAATRARKVACLRSYFKYMHSKAKYIDDNPTKDLESPKLKQSLPNYLTLDECKLLLETVLKNSNGYRDYAIITLFLNCGMRLSELVGINLNDIKNDTLIVTGKGNKERTIYLNNACIQAIEKYMKERPVDNVKDKNALFLSARNQRISNKTIQFLVKKYIQLAGLDTTRFSTHKLRHTAATLMYREGNTDLRTLQEILGHEHLSTTQIYTHVNDEQQKNAMHNNPLANILNEK